MSEERVALVVEDSKDIAILFAAAAREAGYQAEIAHNGAQALARLEKMVPQLVILDLHLPEVPGTEVLDYIRATPHLAATRVIVVTADSRLADTLHDTADIVMLKPVWYHQIRDIATRLAQ